MFPVMIYEIKLVNELWQVVSFLHVLGFPPHKQKENDLPDIMEMLLIAKTPVFITRFIYNINKIKLCHED